MEFAETRFYVDSKKAKTVIGGGER